MMLLRLREWPSACCFTRAALAAVAVCCSCSAWRCRRMLLLLLLLCVSRVSAETAASSRCLLFCLLCRGPRQRQRSADICRSSAPCNTERIQTICKCIDASCSSCCRRSRGRTGSPSARCSCSILRKLLCRSACIIWQRPAQHIFHQHKIADRYGCARTAAAAALRVLPRHEGSYAWLDVCCPAVSELCFIAHRFQYGARTVLVDLTSPLLASLSHNGAAVHTQNKGATVKCKVTRPYQI
jgi:hypothetical protein